MNSRLNIKRQSRLKWSLWLAKNRNVSMLLLIVHIQHKYKVASSTVGSYVEAYIQHNGIFWPHAGIGVAISPSGLCEIYRFDPVRSRQNEPAFIRTLETLRKVPINKN